MLKQIVLTLLTLFTMLGIGCVDLRQANDAAVGELRRRLVDQDFKAIYENSSEVTRSQLSFEAFTSAVKAATDEMKAVDPELNWHRGDLLVDKDVFGDDDYSWLVLEKNGRKMYVQFDWNPNFKLCGMSLSTDVNDSGKGVFRNCD